MAQNRHPPREISLTGRLGLYQINHQKGWLMTTLMVDTTSYQGTTYQKSNFKWRSMTQTRMPQEVWKPLWSIYVITHYTLPWNNSNLTLPFFDGNFTIVLLDNIYQLLYTYIKCFICIIFFHDSIYYTKIGGNENSPNSLIIMVNYHYHSKGRVITR